MSAPRVRVAILCLSVGALLFWLALRCDGLDWYISQTHADILYTALRHFHEWPFYSFVFHGGTYFLQDPQGSLMSPRTLFVLAAGPSVGVRLDMLFWGTLGCWATFAWLRRHVRSMAAAVGAVAWVLSLGFAWRIAVGNEMFLWHLALPLFLLAIEDLVAAPGMRTAVALGLLGGLFVLGPTLHSIVYVMLVALPSYLALQLLVVRPRLAQVGAALAGAMLLSLAIASPKLAAFACFDMRRPVPEDPVIGIGDALRGMFDYFSPHVFRVANIRRYVPTSDSPPSWGIWEVAVALPPTATVLAVVGAVAAIRARHNIALWAMFLTLLALALCCFQPLWHAFRGTAGGGLRVSPRFLALAGFALAVFAAFGAEMLDECRGGRPVLVAVLVLTVASFVAWVEVAAHPAQRTVDDTVGELINPIARARTERVVPDGFHDLVPFERAQRSFLDGHGLTDGFIVVGGNNTDRPLWVAAGPLPIVDGANALVTHTRVEITGLAPGATALVRIREPSRGLLVTSSTSVHLQQTANGLAITNGGPTIARVVLRPRFPISLGWFGLTGTAVLAAVGVIVRRKRPATAAVRMTS